MIDLLGLDRADVLVALCNAARPVGLGYFDPKAFLPLRRDEAEEMLAQAMRFDYVHGRPLKVDLSGRYLDPRLYDRDHGEGAAEAAIAPLRSTEVAPLRSTR